MTVERRLQIVGQDLPAPPYPSDVRAKGWGFDLDVERIEHSTTYLRAPLEMRPWLVYLWMKSWVQSPCGSLPAEDEDVAAVLGMPENVFAANRIYLMRGWVRHLDGRLYHRVITDMVLAMMGRRRRDKLRKSLAAKHSDGFQRIPTDSAAVPVPVPVPAPAPAPAPEKKDETLSRKKPRESAASPNGFAEFWAAYPCKKGKAEALKAWGRLRPDAALLVKILAAIEVQRSSEEWRSGHIKYPQGWLNGRRWEDELDGRPTRKIY
jgi:hypothetical protein